MVVILKLFDHPFLGRGFRPFFFLGGIYSAISILLWIAFYTGYYIPPYFSLDPVGWHAHEMIYGFTIAIVAGFLLTAVANWTGGAPARQIHLAVLCLIWLLGRVVMNIDIGLPAAAIIAIECSFIPALAVSLAIPLIRSWNRRNFIFLTLLTILFLCDVWFMLEGNKTALYVALMVIIIMISLIGGRVIPAFTVAALRRNGIEAFQTPQMKMDIAALISLAAVTLCFIFAKETYLMSLCAGSAALIHALRMRHYHGLKTLKDPILWILQLGYLWLIIGLFLLALTGFGLFPTSMIIHALTAGCIGSMTLGMMCRVSLGHTGRALIASKTTTLSFALIQVAAFMRVFGPMIAPEKSTFWVITSAGLWSFCFLIYVSIYTPMLMRARPDGRKA